MIFCTGEVLADITTDARGVSDMRAGGAPFNVACDVAALGGEAGFYGCVGKDEAGDMLVRFARERRLGGLIARSDLPTTAARVSVDEKGERSFAFDATGTADCELDADVLNRLLPESGVLHLGSLMLRAENGRKYAADAARLARARGLKVSFDINLREGLYPSQRAALDASNEVIRVADILKLSGEEAYALTGERDAAVSALTLSGGVKTVFVTLGERGAVAAAGGKCIFAPARRVKVTDTTGAGDAFFAAALLALSRGKSVADALRAGTEAGAFAAVTPASVLPVD